ncbi:hypothetical protein KKG41_04780 [Patescibacteria group bacterium]|nr:hypothetical protein [Patescibacteria group bacterium]MBU1890807.1 hypothetical protein [Patescibacteria group bacterium]
MSITAQQVAFDKIMNKTVKHWPPPVFKYEDYSGKLYWTLIIRPNKEITDNLSSAISEMEQKWPEHIYYRPDYFHVTMSGIGGVSEIKDYKDRIIEACQNASQNISRIEIEARGLTLGNSIMAMILDTGGNLSKYVFKMRQLFKESNISINEYDDIHTRLWWIVLTRFSKAADRAIIDYIENNNETKYGLFSVKEIDLVEADKTLDTNKTRLIKKIKLSK